MTSHKATSEYINEAVNSIVSASPNYDISIICKILADLIDGQITADDAKQQIESNYKIAEFFRFLSGKQLSLPNGVINIGQNNQIGDISIGNVAGGDICHITINLPKAVEQENILLAEPVVTRFFEDREIETQIIVDNISSLRWCGIFGIGGTGKSALAAHVANLVRLSKSIQVVWIDLGQNISTERILESIARSQGHSLRTIPELSDKCAHLRFVTNEGGLLIVFDDANEDKTLKTVLGSIGNGNSVIVTSRNQGLSSVFGRGLEVISLEPLPPDAATRLLRRLVGSQHLAINEELDSWRALAVSVGCLPLALEVIGGDLRFRPSQKPVEYMNSQVLTGKYTKSEFYSDNLKVVLDSSVGSLSKEDQKAFACLGIFAGEGFSLQAVRAICDFDSDDLVEDFLSALRKRYLVQENKSGIFSLHPVVRQYAQDLLTKQHVIDSVSLSTADRYISFYFQLLQQYGGYEWNIRQYKHLIPHEPEIINATNTAFKMWQNTSAGNTNSYLWLSAIMTSLISWYLHWRGYWDLRVTFSQRITDSLEANNLLGSSYNSMFSSIAGNLYVDRGWVHLQKDEFDQALFCAERGEKILLLSPDVVFAKELRAQVYLQTNKPEIALKLFDLLVRGEEENSRAWFVFSFRKADAISKLNDDNGAINLLEGLLSRIPQTTLYKSEIIEDVHARILFRLARLLQKNVGANLDRLRVLFETTVELFEQAGVIDGTSLQARIELAKFLLSEESSRERAKDLLVQVVKEAQALGETVIQAQASKVLAGIKI